MKMTFKVIKTMTSDKPHYSDNYLLSVSDSYALHNLSLTQILHRDKLMTNQLSG